MLFWLIHRQLLEASVAQFRISISGASACPINISISESTFICKYQMSHMDTPGKVKNRSKQHKLKLICCVPCHQISALFLPSCIPKQLLQARIANKWSRYKFVNEIHLIIKPILWSKLPTPLFCHYSIYHFNN